MSRPPLELADTQKAEVETLAAVLTAEQIADFFGIGRTTFFAMMQRDHEIAERYKKGKARAIGAIAQTLISKARAGDTTSMIFYLKTQAGWRETANLELSAASRHVPESEPDTAFRMFASQLDTMAARLALSAEPVQSMAIKEAEVETATALRA